VSVRPIVPAPSVGTVPCRHEGCVRPLRMRVSVDYRVERTGRDGMRASTVLDYEVEVMCDSGHVALVAESRTEALRKLIAETN